ncbi:MAG: hypothetical protein VXW76_08150 [Actinomycetota bacterium]|nr:hypothetical protein [Actinomycetota bacterium]
MSASRKLTNIRRSIQTHVGNSVIVDGVEYPIFHDYYYGDPEARRDATGTSEPAWIETFFISQGAGRKGESILQVDCYSRIGEEGSASGDPFGILVDDIADAILTPFSGLNMDETRKASFHVMDYSDVQNPVDTGMCIYMINSDGHVGEPEDRVRLNFEQDYRRVTLRLRFQLIQDMLGPAGFYVS